MSKYFINIFLFLFGFSMFAQVNKQIDLSTKKPVEYKQKFGLRVGVDLSRPILSIVDEDYSGIEFVGDYRLKEDLFIAGEIGNETRTDSQGLGNTALFNFTASGSYVKLGADFNTYGNWYGEQNFITIGGRYAFSSFSQTLNDFTIFNTNQFFDEEFPDIATTPEEFSGRTASWLELVVGFKVELFSNIYMGATVRLAYLVTESDNARFPNLWIPGFNQVNDNSSFGIGYNYSISYFLPFYKKSKKKQKEVKQNPQ